MLHNAAAALAAGRFERAVQICSIGLNHPTSVDLQLTLGLMRAEARARLGAWPEVTRDCERLLAVAQTARIFALLAKAEFEQRHLIEAQWAIESALAEEPNLLGHLRLYAEILLTSKQHAAAVETAKQVHARSGDEASIRLVLRALAAAGKPLEVIALTDELVPAMARDAELWCGLGFAHNSLGQDELAVAAFTQALRLEPDRSDAKCGLGYALMRNGDYARGLGYHEHRQEQGGVVARLGVPAWQGEAIEQKHLLVWNEQGMGDMIQFARYLPLAKRVTRDLSFVVPRTLVRLLSSNPQIGRLMVQHPGFVAADVQTLVMSLPYRLGLANQVEVAPVPYLRAESDLVAKWQQRLPNGRCIAMAWQGNPAFAGEPWRSIPLACMAPIIEKHKDQVRFVSLQKHFGSEQLASCGFGADILDLGRESDNEGDAFVDSIAILSSVEIFLTTDTSLAHLAGAAAVPTWLMLPFACDWRWGRRGSTTIWYPNTRVFRQHSPGDWNSVVGDVLTALSELAAMRQA